MSLRKLKHHEQKLLKKVDFLWTSSDSARENVILRRYGIEKREDYIKYNKIVGKIRQMCHKLIQLNEKDPFRTKSTQLLLQKLYNMGLITTMKSLSVCESVTASAFCRRRLPVVMVRQHMAQTLRVAIQYVRQGHVRVGPETITDPAFLVTRYHIYLLFLNTCHIYIYIYLSVL